MEYNSNLASFSVMACFLSSSHYSAQWTGALSQQTLTQTMAEKQRRVKIKLCDRSFEITYTL